MISLDGYPLNICMGWRTLLDIVTTALVLITWALAVVGLYILGVRAVFWIAQLVGDHA